MNGTIMDVHGAGSQRSNLKQDENAQGSQIGVNADGSNYYYKGPQGDILRIDNMVRCVRDTSTQTDTNSSNPNILLIIADDMGLDATPSYPIGSIKPVMPNIQNLIDKGVRFNNFWSNPTCTPTRSSIITGKYGFRVGVTKVGDELSTSETSLQKYLSDNTSYSNAVIGKWHISDDANHPREIGVDYYAGLLTGAVQT